jgi:hypothetical protein
MLPTCTKTSAEDSAVKRTTLIYVIATALAMLGLLGCGTTNKLQSVTLTPTGADGFVNLQGEGATLQFKVVANYTNKQGYDQTNKAVYTVTPMGDYETSDTTVAPLLDPPQTVLMSATGLMTAVEPFVCSWTDFNFPLDRDPANNLKPAWFLLGSYKVVATFKGVASNPAYIAVASAGGNGPNGECGP